MTVLHISSAASHLGANAHPSGPCSRRGGLPGIGRSRPPIPSDGSEAINPHAYGCAGRPNRSDVGASSTMPPAYMTTTSSQMRSTTPRSCVIRMTAVPVPRVKRARRSRICDCVVTSSAEVGSSAMRSAGRLIIAIAIMTLCRSPPDSSCGKAPRRRSAAGNPTSDNASRTRRRSSPRPTRSCTVMASRSWSPIERTGFSEDIGSCEIRPIRRPRTWRSSLSGKLTRSRPSNQAVPLTVAFAGSRPRAARHVADLPDPDSPTIPSTRPGSTARETPRTACTAPPSFAKRTARSWISIVANQGPAAEGLHRRLKDSARGS